MIAVTKLVPENTELVLNFLQKHAVRNCWVLNDLLNFTKQSDFLYAGDPGLGDFTFLHRSGHPSSRSVKTIILRGMPHLAKQLMEDYELVAPFLIRETSFSMIELIKASYPDALIYPQIQMCTDEPSFRAVDDKQARVLTLGDLDALAVFTKSPPEAKERLSRWVTGAIVVGVVDKEVLVSMGSTLFALEEAALLVAVETLPQFQRRGYAMQVASLLTKLALQWSHHVTLTVRLENAGALNMYERLGFVPLEKRLWASVGCSAAP